MKKRQKVVHSSAIHKVRIKPEPHEKPDMEKLARTLLAVAKSLVAKKRTEDICDKSDTIS